MAKQQLEEETQIQREKETERERGGGIRMSDSSLIENLISYNFFARFLKRKFAKTVKTILFDLRS